jgi:hypothetical protein
LLGSFFVPDFRPFAANADQNLHLNCPDDRAGLGEVYANENAWLTQKMVKVLYDVNMRTVNEHQIFAESELLKDSAHWPGQPLERHLVY